MSKQTTKRTTIEVMVDLSTGELIVRMPLSLPPMPSASGKTLVIASTRGNLTTNAQYDGQAIILGLNAYIRKQ
jgi:hypothetical protein